MMSILATNIKLGKPQPMQLAVLLTQVNMDLGQSENVYL